MAEAQDQSMYCKVHKKSFADWEAFFLHKVQSKDHICCIFCGQDYRTVEGCRRHQHQSHSAEQDLACAGCGTKFVRVGSYISHIELMQCPVIHHSEFEARRLLKGEVYGKESGVKVPGEASVPAIPSTIDHRKASGNIPGNIANTDGAPFKYDKPKETSWEEWGDNDTALLDEAFPALIKNKVFPALPLQEYRDGGSKVLDLLTGTADSFDEKNLAWFAQKELFPNLPKPATAKAQSMASTALIIFPEGEYHHFDPDNPKFNAQDYYNPFAEKYRCPWPGCTKLQKTRAGFVQHLKSATHMDLKLRCPQCLRQYSSATSLVQHAESQGVSCKIRNTNEYRQAIDLVTAGFIDTAGRHRDETVRYVAPPTALGPVSAFSHETMNKGTAAFLAKQDEIQEEKMTRINEGKQDW